MTVCAALALVVACDAAPALALEPGVHLDPGSPAEKEYVLRLNQARQTGAPAHGEGSGEGSAPNLFGAGITPPSSGGPRGAPSGAAGARSGREGTQNARGGSQTSGTPRARRGSRPASHATSPPLPASVLRAARSPDSAGDGSLLTLIGGGLAILVIGGFGGTVLRHSRRPNPSR
jgi:hypothetical protein